MGEIVRNYVCVYVDVYTCVHVYVCLCDVCVCLYVCMFICVYVMCVHIYVSFQSLALSSCVILVERAYFSYEGV